MSLKSSMDSKATTCSSSRFKQLSPTRRTDSSSPEFEFWALRNNPTCPQPNLLSADELFVDGVILPLRLLNKPDTESAPDPEPEPDPEPHSSTSASAAAAAPVATASKRWRDMFKKGEKKEAGVKDVKKERKTGAAAAGGASSAELNINLWPFSRSRSAGNAGTRPKPTAPATRKVNSAPCSRSNSTGESKSQRKWPASPGRAGVHLGRSSPVWQVRRGKGPPEAAQVRNTEKSAKKDAPEARRSKTAVHGGAYGGHQRARVLNLNVPTCIGYRSNLGCRSDVSSAVSGSSCSSSGGANYSRGVGGGGVHGGGDSNSSGVAGSNLFNLRSLFTKKVY